MNFSRFWIESTVQTLANCCVLLVFIYSTKINGKGNQQGNTAQALIQWSHPVASCEALNFLYWAMGTALHWCCHGNQNSQQLMCIFSHL
jgi:hypothetical protein